MLAEHDGIVDQLHADGRWARAVADYAAQSGRPMRLVMLTDARTSGGRSRAQAFAQHARNARQGHEGRRRGFRRQRRDVDKAVPSLRSLFTCCATPTLSRCRARNSCWGRAGSGCAATRARAPASATAAQTYPCGSTTSLRSVVAMTAKPARVVDAHVHLWDPARTDWYPYLSGRQNSTWATRRAWRGCSTCRRTRPSRRLERREARQRGRGHRPSLDRRDASSSTSEPTPRVIPTRSSADSRRPTRSRRRWRCSTGRCRRRASAAFDRWVSSRNRYRRTTFCGRCRSAACCSRS